VNYATAYPGADHNKGYAAQEVFGIPIPYPVERLEIKGKGILAKWNQDFSACFDVPIFCAFPILLAVIPAAQKVTADLLSGVTGLEFSEQDVWQLGERLNNLARMFNVREGFSRKDDYLPRRLMEEPIKDGLSKGEMISQQDLDFMLDEYYEARGWDKNGIPTAAKLQELGLEDTIKDLPPSS
jgi:aldehyde:ferredoxin oxidoreductase